MKLAIISTKKKKKPHTRAVGERALLALENSTERSDIEVPGDLPILLGSTCTPMTGNLMNYLEEIMKAEMK
jgi:hypothetical protein